jgi:lipoprotein-releasing system ATP-binding protein
VPEEALRAQGLVKVYPGLGTETHVLRGVDLSVGRGELVAVVGPSGAGKTTLLYMLGGLARPSGGEVWLDGQPIFRLSDEALSSLRNRRLGFVFQYHHLLPDLDASDNVALPLRVSGASRREARQKARALLQTVGLGHRLEHKPGELSGGEQQRVAMARALVLDPAVILADEPTGNLDKANSEGVFDLLRAATREGRQAVVMVTHNPALAKRADRTVRMEDGVIL